MLAATSETCSARLRVAALVRWCSLMLLLVALAAGCSGDDPAAGDEGDGAVVPASATVAHPDHAPPNLILVTIDTLRADRVGAYAPGDARVHTPTLDAFAARGVRYARAITTAPLTLPAHASMLTGLTPVAHHVRDNVNYRLPPEATTLAETLSSDYATAAFVSAQTLLAPLGLNQGFEHYDDTLVASDIPGYTLRERRGAATIDAALAWLDARVRRSASSHTPWRPIFLWVHLFDPHYPYAAPEDLRPPEAKDATRRHLRAQLAALPDDASAERRRWEQEKARYDAEVTYADAQLGRLRDAIDRIGLGPHTGWVLTADHGESLDDLPEATHGFFVGDPTCHVPLILVPPAADPTRGLTLNVAAKHGAVIEAPISTAAIHDLLLHLARISAGTTPAAPSPYVESYYGHLAFGYAPIVGRVRDGRYELWERRPQDNRPERRAEADRFDAYLAALSQPPLGDPLIPPALGRSSGVDLAGYPGLAEARVPTAPAANEDGTYGATYPGRVFPPQLMDPALAGPSLLDPAVAAEIAQYQRAQRLAAAQKYPLVRAVLDELIARRPDAPPPPALQLLTECWRAEAEDRLGATLHRLSRERGADPAGTPRLPAVERTAVLARYRGAAEAYARYVDRLTDPGPAQQSPPAALAAGLRARLGLRWFFAGDLDRAEATLAALPADRLPPRASLALALTYLYQDADPDSAAGPTLAREVLRLQQLADGSAGERLLRALVDDPAAVSRDPAVTNPGYGFP